MKLFLNLVLLMAIATLCACSQPASDSAVDESPSAAAESTDASEPDETEPEVTAEPDSADNASDSSLPGLAVGAKAPEFALKDQSGQERKLSELLGQGAVALVFYRSADW